MKQTLHTLVQKIGADKKTTLKFVLLVVVASFLGLFGLLYGGEITDWLRHPDQVRDTLLELGCTVFQGYLYSPAVPLEELLFYSPPREGNA